MNIEAIWLSTFDVHIYTLLVEFTTLLPKFEEIWTTPKAFYLTANQYYLITEGPLQNQTRSIKINISGLHLSEAVTEKIFYLEFSLRRM